MEIIIILIIILIFCLPIIKIINKKEKTEDYSNRYKKKYLLTQNEYREYNKLKTYAEKYNLIICPKVRLLDIIEPIQGEDIIALRKIQSKHIDFVICDNKLYIKGIIELDDVTHERKDRQERDKFVDEIMNSVGYKIIHTRSISEEIIKVIINKDENTIES